MKSPIKKILMFALVGIAILGLSSCGYNRMQQLEEGVNRAWGDLEAQLQRRADLVPNLVATVKGYASHERETLEAVVNARARATSVQLTPEMLSDPEAVAQFQEAQGSLSSALSRLLVVVEAYPDLKANQNFRDLQVQLEGTENRISVARQRYNQAVEQFNFSIRRFPNSLTNRLLLHLERKEYYEADAAAREAPKVEF
jgi:LemA protein